MPPVRIPHSLLAVCASALLLSPAFPAQAGQKNHGMPRAERHEIRLEIDQLEDKWRDAALHDNVQVMSSLLAEDYTAITAYGTLQSKEQTLESLRDGSLRFTAINESDRKVRFYGHTALVTSKAEVVGTTPEGKLSGDYRYARVYVRDPRGSWKIVSFEISPIRQPGEHK